MALCNALKFLSTSQAFFTTISGEGIVGQKHYKEYPTTVYLKLVPNRRMVLESAQIVYESGLADSVVVSDLSTIYNEKGRYYELTLSEEEYAEGCGFDV